VFHKKQFGLCGLLSKLLISGFTFISVRGNGVADFRKRIFFLSNSSIAQLCEDLNKIPGRGIYHDRFKIQNT